MDIDPNRRWKEIDDQLVDLLDGRVVDGDPVEVEARLLEEQDELEWLAGEKFFRDRDEGA